ncbi:MAG: hypothetical protein ACKVWR_23000, partial [Acidimicrobiales bacterium]
MTAPPRPAASEWFSAGDWARAAAYHRGRRRLEVAQTGLLAALIAVWVGARVPARLVEAVGVGGRGVWWLELVVIAAGFGASAAALVLPIEAWRWVVHERRYARPAPSLAPFAAAAL